MQPSNIAAGASKLQHDLKELHARWGQARDEWDDPVSRDFEQTQLATLDHATSIALHGIDEIQQFVRRMVQAIGPNE